MAGKFGQFAADDFRRAAADAGIDFVKHNGFHRIGVRQNRFQGQDHPRKLTAGGDTGQRF